MQIHSKTKHRFVTILIIIAMAGVTQIALAHPDTILPLTLDSYLNAEVAAGNNYNDDYGFSMAEAWVDDWVFVDDDGDEIPEEEVYADAYSNISCGYNSWGAGIISSISAHDMIMMGGYGLCASAAAGTAPSGTLTIGTSTELPFGSEITLCVEIDASLEIWWDGTYDYQFQIFREDVSLIDTGMSLSDLFNITAYAGETLDIEFWHSATASAYYDQPETLATCDMCIDMWVAPEPATICLLCLGGLMIGRKK